MKAIILHESKGRIRFRISQKKMTLQEADVLENWFQKKSWITQVTVHERTGCVILQYSGSRKEVLAAIREFNLQEAQSQITLPLHSSRELNRKFQEKLVGKVVLKAASMLFFAEAAAHRAYCMAYAPFFEKGNPMYFERKTEGRCSGCTVHRHFPCFEKISGQLEPSCSCWNWANC